jgi:ABC-type transport system involved in multi-copper enzyme maturation permease subunit
MTSVAPPSSHSSSYASRVRPARESGFLGLVHAEWTKLRTVRGWVAALLLAVLLPVGITLLGHSECGIVTPAGQTVGCPGLPTGPDGSAVVDTFYFVHQALPADGSITARVTSLTGRHGGAVTQGAANQATAETVPGVEPWSKVGIMIKASTKAGSAYASMLVTGANGTRMQWDYTGDTAGLSGSVSAAAPRWLRLVRAGSVVTGYDSADGVSWTRVGSLAVRGLPASGSVQVGLFATSPSHAVTTSSFGSTSTTGGPSLATGSFDRVSVTGAAAGSWTGSSIQSGAAVQPPQPGGPGIFNGSFRPRGDTAFTVSGSGDIGPNAFDGPDGTGTSPQSALSGMFAALLMVIIVAALFIAAEYRRGMILVTLAAAPSRWRVLLAKAAVIGLVAFVVGLVAVGATLPLGLSRLRSGGNWIAPISALTETRMIVGTALLIAVSAVLALAIGTVARRGVIAIAGVIVVIFVPFMLSQVPGLLPVGAQDWLLRPLPTAAFSLQQAYPAYHQVAAPYWPADGYYPLSPWAGFAVLCAWAVAALALAGWMLRRRDA